MPKRPYRPSGASEHGAYPVLFGGCLAAGLLAGVAEGLSARYLISLLIVFPVGIGLAAGGFGAWRVRVAKIRAPSAAAAAALLGALAGQVAVHAMAYQAFRAEVGAALRQQGAEQADAAVDEVLAEETGRGGFLGYLDLAAKSGVTLKRGGGKGVKVSGPGAWILWAVEMLLALGVGGWIAWDRARQPFCERCKQWYGPPTALALGSPQKAAWQAALRALERGDPAAAASALGQPEPKATSVLRLARCPRCDTHEPALSLVVVTGLHTKKPQTRVKYESMLRAEEGRALAEALEAAGHALAPGAQVPP